MSKPTDDLEAVRVIADTLQPFAPEDRERIVRWARERVGMPGYALGSPSALAASASAQETAAAPALQVAQGADIKTFIDAKSPSSDTHFAAAVAYYHQFVAPVEGRKASINKDDLVNACRTADRKRPRKPAQVLVNAYHEGILDRAEKGQYKLNSVGENLVAMVLPGKPEGKRGAAPARKRSPKASNAKRVKKRNKS